MTFGALGRLSSGAVHAQVFNVKPTLHDFHLKELPEACVLAAATPLLPRHGLEGYSERHTQGHMELEAVPS